MEWLRVQLTHDVSLAATDGFWSLAKTWIPRIFNIRNTQGIRRKFPQFQNQRKKLYRNECPKVSMSFGYLNNDTQAIVHVKNVEHTPRKTYDRNTKFSKLYECAYIQVNYLFNWTNKLVKFNLASL